MTLPLESVHGAEAEAYLAAYLQTLEKYNRETFHPTGIDSETMVGFIATKSVVCIDGVPSLVHSNVAAPLMVDRERFDRLTTEAAPDVEDEAKYVSAVPLTFIAERLSLPDINQTNKDRLVLVEWEHADDEIVQTLENNGIKTYVFKHPLYDTIAGLSLICANLKPREPTKDMPLSLKSTIQSGRISRAEVVNDTTVITRRIGGEFSPEEIEQLVELYRTRFDDISTHMPIRLDESDDETRKLANNSDYVFLTTSDRKDGKILACLFFTDVTGAYPWINDSYLTAHTPYSINTDEKPHHVFIPALAKRRDAPARHGALLTSDYCKVAYASGQNHVVNWFECTDISKHVVAPTARVSMDILFKGSVEEIDTKTYMLLRIPAKPNS